MKKVLLLLIAIFSLFISQAQLSESENLLARNLVTKNKDLIGLSAESLNNYIVSSSFDNPVSNSRMVYLQQTYKGIPVYNQMLVLAFRNGALLSKAGLFDPSFEKFVNNNSGIPAKTAESAVLSAIADRKLASSDIAPVIINRSNKGDFVEFNDMGISREHITAQLIWAPIENTPNFHLAWQVYIIPKTTSDYWMVRVDAMDSRIIGVDNYTDYDNWDLPAVEDNVNTSNDLQTDESFQSRVIYNQVFYFNDNKKQQDLISTATYRVIPLPYESPIHMPSPPSSGIVTDPWLAAPGNATTLKWNTGAAGTDYNYTRGNNVWAYHDRTNSNSGSIARSATSTTPLPNLTFDFMPDYTVSPTLQTPPNEQFNITNLFYWNNIIHDVFYQYGFTEAGGNFQDDNMGRGGAGNDHVNAEAQDGSGSNNANFSTPVDGNSGRMQMYLWTAPNPDRDGDVDNGIIVHEHGHGIGKRVTGGPAIVSCLTSAETQGEGISDYFGLMLTQNWATATLSTGFDSPRGVGTYALNQPITGAGIRPKRYTTNFAINGDTYANLPPLAIPHGVGYLWCTMLWEMTWELINTIGSISPNIYDNTASGGNVVALNLVMEGLRLQPCQPGFVDAKNAILQADMNLYGGANQCAIIRAFARRGLGVNALQGSVTSRTDQTPDFTGGGPVMGFTQNGAAGVPEGQNIIYNHTVTANCQAITGHTLRDTLPLNVTFVNATNGGTYDNGTRVVSWPVNLAVNATGNYGLTVQINPGSYFPPDVLINETVLSTTIDPFWTTATTIPANAWIAHSTRSKSPANSFYTPNGINTSDQTLATTNSFSIGATPPELSFWHWYNSESGWDGGVLEISTNGGTTWSDIGAANFSQNGYNGTLGSSPSPLSGRQAWTGNSAGFVQTKVNMTPYANQASVKLRWRFGSDNSVGGTGWNVDDIQLQTIAVVNLRTSLFNAVNARVDLKDTVTVILPLVISNPAVTINQAVGQPDPTTASPINFTVVFDQPVTGFATGDVTLSGTALATTGIVTEVAPNDGTTFNVAVTGMTVTGTVIANIAAGVCTNAAMDPNLASSSSDNQVIFSIEPLNDLCANAELITCSQTIMGTTVNSTFDNAPTCTVTNTSPGVWYKFIGNGGATTVSLCGSAFDTKVSVFSGTCGALVCVDGNDDFCGPQSQVIIPTTSGVTYYVLVHGSGSTTGAFNLTLTCTCPTLTVDPVPNQTLCNGSNTTTVTFTGLEPNTIYNWTNSNTSIGLAATGTGDITSFTATNTGTAPVTATITVTPTYIGCPNGPSTMFTITVNPTPSVTAVSNQTLCNGAMTAPVNFTGPVAGTVFNWANNTPSIGLAANGTGDIASFTATNTGTAPVTATITVTPVNSTGTTCTGTPRTFTITVNPTPVATATPATQTTCSGAAITSIVLTSATAGTTFAWTRNNTATVTGIAASGNGNITGALTNATTASVTVTFTITPTANGCAGTSITATVTVNPTPQVDPVANQTVCNGTMTAPINFTGSLPGTTFAWSNSNTAIGLGASGTGNIPAFTATNASTLPITGTVTVTPQLSLAGSVIVNGSLNASDPTLTAGRLNRNGVASSCATPKTFPGVFGTGPFFYDLYTLVNNTGASQCVTVSYSSTTTNQVHVTAYNGSFNPANIAANYIADGGNSSTGAPRNFTFTAPAGATIIFHIFEPIANQVCPSYTVIIDGLPATCSGPSKTFDITVNPTPTITCPANITKASSVGACNVAVDYTPTVTGTPNPTLSYVLSGATTGSGTGTGSGLLFNVGVTTVTLKATNVCAAPTCSFTVTVTDSQLPSVTTQPVNRTVCAGSNATFSVTAVTIPSAGGPIAYQWQLWNGTTWNNIAGATSSSYTLNSVTQNMNTNSYRVQLTGLCSTVYSNFATLYVNPLPTINLSTSIPPALLPNQVLTITATTAPGGGSYVWYKDGTIIPGATGNTLTGLTVSDIGTYHVVYTDPKGCVSTSSDIEITAQASGTLYVYPVPNRGIFNVRFYNQANEEVTVRVFDTKGAEVFQRKVLTTIPYTTINIDLTAGRIIASESYVVEVRGNDGRLVGTKKIIVNK